MVPRPLSFVAILALGAVAAGAADAPRWGYDGKLGPKHWARLSPRFRACAKGHAQSPIDLRWSKPKGGSDLQFDYRPTGYTVVDDGHTVRVNFKPGNRIRLDGREFELVELQFHAQSEHTLSGKSFPLEAQLVHKDASGRIAVVGVFFREGSVHLTLGKIWAGVPTDKGRESLGEGKLDPSAFLPSQRTHYRYVGSLTTPPCTEGVAWSVLNTPIDASAEQLARFRRLYAANHRPLQPLHDRRPANY